MRRCGSSPALVAAGRPPFALGQLTSRRPPGTRAPIGRAAKSRAWGRGQGCPCGAAPAFGREFLFLQRADRSTSAKTSVSGRFERLVRESRLPRIRLHDLRHTGAILLLAAGINPKSLANASDTRVSSSRSIPTHTSCHPSRPPPPHWRERSMGRSWFGNGSGIGSMGRVVPSRLFASAITHRTCSDGTGRDAK